MSSCPPPGLFNCSVVARTSRRPCVSHVLLPKLFHRLRFCHFDSTGWCGRNCKCCTPSSPHRFTYGDERPPFRPSVRRRRIGGSLARTRAPEEFAKCVAARFGFRRSRIFLLYFAASSAFAPTLSPVSRFVASPLQFEIWPLSAASTVPFDLNLGAVRVRGGGGGAMLWKRFFILF